MRKFIYLLTLLVACNEPNNQPADLTDTDILGYYHNMSQYDDYSGLDKAMDPVHQKVEIREEGYIIFHTIIGSHSGGHASLQRWEMSGNILTVIKPDGQSTQWKIERTSYGLRLSNDQVSMLLQRIKK